MRQDGPLGWISAAVGAAARRVARVPPLLAPHEAAPERSESTGPLLRELAACLEPKELEEAILELLVRDESELTALVSLDASTAKPSRVRRGDRVELWHPAEPTPSLIAVPIRLGDESFGWVAYVEDEAAARAGDRPAKRLLTVADAAAIPARNVRRHSAALDLSLRDPLTGLFNRRAFEAFLEQEVERSRREARPLALMMLDLDRFKTVNDTLGHPAGDEAIRRTARTLTRSTRRSDIVARMGGDEFAVLLPGSDAANAERLGARILEALDKRLAAFDLGLAGPPPSASVGVADLSETDGDATRLVELADGAQISAKRAGGNRVARIAERRACASLIASVLESWP